MIAGGIGISTVAFQGASNPGGADSPEEAVREFADAVEREDVLGMIDVALPEEVTALRAVFEDATNEVERVGILDESFSLAAVAGIDITLPGLTLTTESIGADLAVVTATGGIVNATFDPTVFPLGSVVREVLGDDLATSQLSQPLSGSDPSVMLATVARDGRWYVSLGFTVAEYARVAAGAEFPPPATIERVGLDSPEAAALDVLRTARRARSRGCDRDDGARRGRRVAPLLPAVPPECDRRHRARPCRRTDGVDQRRRVRDVGEWGSPHADTRVVRRRWHRSLDVGIRDGRRPDAPDHRLRHGRPVRGRAPR